MPETRLASELKMDTPDKVVEVIETPKPDDKKDGIPNPDSPQLSQEDEDRIALAAINKRRGTNFTSLDEAFATPAPEVVETEEQKKEKREKEKIQFALQNEIVSPSDLENFHKDSARDARSLVYAEFYAKRRAAGDDDAKIERKFAKLYGEDLEEDEHDDTPAFVRQQRAEDLAREAKRILKSKYPKIHSLDKQYDEHVSALAKQKESNEKLTATAKVYVQDVNEFFTGIQPEKVKVGGEAGKPETDFETDFVYPKDVLDKVQAEILDKDTVVSFIGNYNKEALYKYIRLRLLEETHADSIGHAAKRYAQHLIDKKDITRKHLIPESIVGGSSGGASRSRLGQHIGIPADNIDN